jgi:5'-3' exonuclease
MSRELAQIEVNLKIKFDLEHAKVTPFDGTKLENFFKEMEFRTLLSKVPVISGSAPAPVTESAPRTAKTKSGQMTMFVNEPQMVMEIKACKYRSDHCRFRCKTERPRH